MPIDSRPSLRGAVALCVFVAACATERGTPAGDTAAVPATPTATTVPALELRLDDPSEPISGVHVMPVSDGWHVTTGPATILYNGADTASGNYTVEATFQQLRAPEHAEAYGLFAAGNNLTATNISYLYFLVRRDGQWTLKHRADDRTVHTIVDWTSNAAVQAQDSAGQSTNTLAMAFGADSVRMSVNGTAVATIARNTLESGPDHSGTTGVAGVRVNHALDVQVTNFRITRQ